MRECLINGNNHNVESDPGFMDFDEKDLRVKVVRQLCRNYLI